MSRLRLLNYSTEELAKMQESGKAYLDLVVKGKWIPTENEEMETDGYFCSVCSLPMETEEKTDFCPNCGADMRDEDYDCMACAHDGDSNICCECEDGSKYLKWRTIK